VSPRPEVSGARSNRRLGPLKLVALAICIGFALAFVVSNVKSWQLEDMDAYWNAALRIQHGQQLYPAVANPGSADVYRYAPWFAWLWIPFTELPKGVVQIGWSCLLLASIPISIRPLLRRPTAAAICLAALAGGLLFKTASTGNVHALMIAMLVSGVARSTGPLWIGLAASLKGAPLAYAIVYAGRREWRRALMSLAVALVLIAPAALYDVSYYPTDAGDSFSLLSLAGPVPFFALAAVAVATSIRLARTQFAWGAASVAVLCLIPRLDLYGLTYLLVGLMDRSPRLAPPQLQARDDAQPGARWQRGS
jgi:hypothetical protein